MIRGAGEWPHGNGDQRGQPGHAGLQFRRRHDRRRRGPIHHSHVFTATDTSQPITLTGSASTQLNALLLSDVTATGYQPVNHAPLTARAGWVPFQHRADGAG